MALTNTAGGVGGSAGVQAGAGGASSSRENMVALVRVVVSLLEEGMEALMVCVKNQPCV